MSFTKLSMVSLPRSIAWSFSTFFTYSLLDTLSIQGASQFFKKYSRHGFLGSLSQILILNSFLKSPTVRYFELPRTKGPYTLPFGPDITPIRFLRATRRRGNFSSVILRYVYLC